LFCKNLRNKQENIASFGTVEVFAILTLARGFIKSFGGKIWDAADKENGRDDVGIMGRLVD